MIHDTLENSGLYEALNPNFKEAFDHLRTTDFENMAPCKYSLNDDVRVVVSVTQGHKPSESEVEVHDEFVDIQMPLNVIEMMGWVARKNLKKVTRAYDSSKDIAFYAEPATDYVSVSPREFVIFFPSDGHQPRLTEGEIKKVIVKVRNK